MEDHYAQEAITIVKLLGKDRPLPPEEQEQHGIKKQRWSISLCGQTLIIIRQRIGVQGSVGRCEGRRHKEETSRNDQDCRQRPRRRGFFHSRKTPYKAKENVSDWTRKAFETVQSEWEKSIENRRTKKAAERKDNAQRGEKHAHNAERDDETTSLLKRAV